MKQALTRTKTQKKISELILKNKYEVQVNLCHNVKCKDYGKSAQLKGTQKNLRHRLTCQTCNKQSFMYSNYGILKSYEEMSGIRYITQLDNEKHSCKDNQCGNHNHSVLKFPNLYKKNGKSKNGSQRYKCKECGKTLTVANRKNNYAYHRKDHKDKNIFNSLIHGLGIRRISYLNEISPQTVYNKLEFFYEQCLHFNHLYDEKIKKKKFDTLRLSTDSFKISTNWRVNPKDNRKGVGGLQLSMLTSVDNNSGFVFTQTIPFDGSVLSKKINEWAKNTGEIEKLECDRKHPQYLFYQESGDGDNYLNNLRGKNGKDIDVYGIKIDDKYHRFGHYYALNKSINNVKRLVIYADAELKQDAFIKKIFKDKTIDDKCYFYTMSSDFRQDTTKEKTQSQNRAKLTKKEFLYQYSFEKEQREEIAKLAETDPVSFINKISKLEYEVSQKSIKEKLKHIKNKIPGKWIQHPTPKERELNKDVKLENKVVKDCNIDDVANDILRASGWGVDNYFLKIRTLSFFKRELMRAGTKRGKASVWKNGKSYDPTKLVMMAEIYKTYHNFINVGKDKKTPAQRLGLTKKIWTINQILTKKYK